MDGKSKQFGRNVARSGQPRNGTRSRRLEGNGGGNLTQQKKADIEEIKYDVLRKLDDLRGTPCLDTFSKYDILLKRDELMCKLRVKNTDVKKARVLSATCPDMCPEKERYMRDVQKLVNEYECGANGTMAAEKAVKDYSRSAADQEEPLPHELRPPAVLKKTMDYLIFEFMSNWPSRQELPKWYDFLWTRTRSIRKEVTQQMLSDQLAAELVEKCTRFHIFAGYAMLGFDANTFNERLNTENLSKCIQTLRHIYDDLAKKNEFCESEAEFRAYDILLNLTDSNVFSSVRAYRDEIRTSAPFQLAVKLACAFQTDNYVVFFRLMKDATFLQSSLIFSKIVQFRLEAITTILRTFRGKYPIESLKNDLGFANVDECAEVARQLGIMDEVEQTLARPSADVDLLDDIDYNIGKGIVQEKLAASLDETIANGRVQRAVFPKPINSFTFEGYYENDPVLKEFLEQHQFVPGKSHQKPKFEVEHKEFGVLETISNNGHELHKKIAPSAISSMLKDIKPKPAPFRARTTLGGVPPDPTGTSDDFEFGVKPKMAFGGFLAKNEDFLEKKEGRTGSFSFASKPTDNRLENGIKNNGFGGFLNGKKSEGSVFNAPGKNFGANGQFGAGTSSTGAFGANSSTVGAFGTTSSSTGAFGTKVSNGAPTFSFGKTEPKNGAVGALGALNGPFGAPGSSNAPFGAPGPSNGVPGLSGLFGKTGASSGLNGALGSSSGLNGAIGSSSGLNGAPGSSSMLNPASGSNGAPGLGNGPLGLITGFSGTLKLSFGSTLTSQTLDSSSGLKNGFNSLSAPLSFGTNSLNEKDVSVSVTLPLPSTSDDKKKEEERKKKEQEAKEREQKEREEKEKAEKKRKEEEQKRLEEERRRQEQIEKEKAAKREEKRKMKEQKRVEKEKRRSWHQIREKASQIKQNLGDKYVLEIFDSCIEDFIWLSAHNARELEQKIEDFKEKRDLRIVKPYYEKWKQIMEFSKFLANLPKFDSDEAQKRMVPEGLSGLEQPPVKKRKLTPCFKELEETRQVYLKQRYFLYCSKIAARRWLSKVAKRRQQQQQEEKEPSPTLDIVFPPVDLNFEPKPPRKHLPVRFEDVHHTTFHVYTRPNDSANSTIDRSFGSFKFGDMKNRRQSLPVAISTPLPALNGSKHKMAFEAGKGLTKLQEGRGFNCNVCCVGCIWSDMDNV
ncbi:unnamed protein product [Bursaphelenchus okinawaensis]|uniref:SAC3/GANP/THP3 conserved domain-containing protein n=1 Tax=Bursaphelenchus okinawaensis TaxID=465554 RepID=A0A811KZ60_9BILA|nr:unnamed protein product [Bursaphelenchus okinawaensis]CAG9114662.1 unnamed protein product [Bursaphelenchus okinawaensis]